MIKFTPNIALKVAILESGRRQCDIARSARISSEARFSHIVRGRVDATKRERASIARVLQRSQDQLFPASDQAMAS